MIVLSQQYCCFLGLVAYLLGRRMSGRIKKYCWSSCSSIIVQASSQNLMRAGRDYLVSSPPREAFLATGVNGHCDRRTSHFTMEKGALTVSESWPSLRGGFDRTVILGERWVRACPWRTAANDLCYVPSRGWRRSPMGGFRHQKC